jgi:hypothetical protein
MRPAKPTPKICACCGARTAPLQQWHNQDTGFALCGPCSNTIELRYGAQYLRETYGERGVHIE